MNAEIQRIIDVANELVLDGRSAGSTSEIIAAAFILNDMDKLPAGYHIVVDAWARLGDWQGYVGLIRREYRHLLVVNTTPRCI
jgi:hypothetical protein